jgi:hypothetical protein
MNSDLLELLSLWTLPIVRTVSESGSVSFLRWNRGKIPIELRPFKIQSQLLDNQSQSVLYKRLFQISYINTTVQSLHYYHQGMARPTELKSTNARYPDMYTNSNNNDDQRPSVTLNNCRQLRTISNTTHAIFWNYRIIIKFTWSNYSTASNQRYCNPIKLKL